MAAKAAAADESAELFASPAWFMKAPAIILLLMLGELSSGNSPGRLPELEELLRRSHARELEGRPWASEGGPNPVGKPICRPGPETDHQSNRSQRTNTHTADRRRVFAHQMTRQEQQSHYPQELGR